MFLRSSVCVYAMIIFLRNFCVFAAEMETGRVAGRVEILRPAGQAG